MKRSVPGVKRGENREGRSVRAQVSLHVLAGKGRSIQDAANTVAGGTPRSASAEVAVVQRGDVDSNHRPTPPPYKSIKTPPPQHCRRASIADAPARTPKVGRSMAGTLSRPMPAACPNRARRQTGRYLSAAPPNGAAAWPPSAGDQTQPAANGMIINDRTGAIAAAQRPPLATLGAHQRSRARRQSGLLALPSAGGGQEGDASAAAGARQVPGAKAGCAHASCTLPKAVPRRALQQERAVGASF